MSDAHAWARELSFCPRQPADSLTMLSTLRLALRLALRQACADHDQHDEALNAVFGTIALQAKVKSIEGVSQLRLESLQKTYAGHVLSIVANAIAAGHFSRLKTCDDCQWAFYDHTRSGNKRWCGMTKGGPQGRACGTIAKVSAFRQRAADKARKGDA